MLRTVTKKTFLLLEGDSDCNALDPHIEQSVCETVPGYSKSAILRAIELVELNQTDGVAGLVDRDWVGFCQPAYPYANCFLTDRYDLDATIFFSGDLAERFFSAHGERANRESYLANCGAVKFADVAAALALPLGVLRFISIRDGHHLRLRDFPIQETLNTACTETDVESIIDLSLRRSEATPSLSKAQLSRHVAEQVSKVPDAKDYCNGHDIARVAARVVTRILRIAINHGAVERTMRSMLDEANLKQFQFYLDLAKWADARGLRIWKYEHEISKGALT
jgi:hypothetical protein